MMSSIVPTALLIVLLTSVTLASAVGQEKSVELFLFQSTEDESALTSDRSGAKLPKRVGGWMARGSFGDPSDKLRDSDVARLRSDGYFILPKEQPRSLGVEDWRPLPPGLFKLTDAALIEVRRFHKELSRHMGGQSVVSFTWGRVAVKGKDSPKWHDVGDRLIAGGFPETDVPAGAVEQVAGVPVSFQFDPKALPVPTPTKIDYGPHGFVFAD